MTPRLTTDSQEEMLCDPRLYKNYMNYFTITVFGETGIYQMKTLQDQLNCEICFKREISCMYNEMRNMH